MRAQASVVLPASRSCSRIPSSRSAVVATTLSWPRISSAVVEHDDAGRKDVGALRLHADHALAFFQRHLAPACRERAADRRALAASPAPAAGVRERSRRPIVALPPTSATRSHCGAVAQRSQRLARQFARSLDPRLVDDRRRARPAPALPRSRRTAPISHETPRSRACRRLRRHTRCFRRRYPRRRRAHRAACRTPSARRDRMPPLLLHRSTRATELRRSLARDWRTLRRFSRAAPRSCATAKIRT